MELFTLDDGAILQSVQVARGNWGSWRDVFEHSGPTSENPLLASPKRFASFCKEYSVIRTIRAGKHDEFLSTLRDSSQFKDAIDDDSGGTLDSLENELRRDFGTHDGTRRMVSVISKVAAFVRPERFVAWDKYAKKGVNIVLRRPASSSFSNYAEYLRAFEQVWDGEAGQQIRDYLTSVNTSFAVETEPRFQRRILDVHLMKCGGRKL
jgi:hypothetical protein